MPRLIDLTGHEVDGWTVLSPAETVKRVRFWNVMHMACSGLEVRPHAMLTTNAVAPCPTCEPATEVGITLGHHQGPGDPAHVVGTPCADQSGTELVHPEARCGTVGPGECKHGVTWRTCAMCAPTGGVTIPEAPPAKATKLELVRKATDYPVEAFWAAVAKAEVAAPLGTWPIPDLAPCPEPVAEPAELVPVDAAEGIATWYGRAEAAAEAQEYLAVIRTKITQPARWSYVGTGRSPGMSVLGGCERKLGGLLAFGRLSSTAWRPAIGTAADEHVLGPAFDEDNRRAVAEWVAHSWETVAPPGRWLTKARLNVGGARGVLDLYDRWAGEILDFKVSGVTKLDATRRGHVSSQYETQLDLYGLGVSKMGYLVNTVALLVLPMGGRSCELEDASYYRRAWNPDNAHRALARRDRISAMLTVAPAEVVLESLTIEADACDYCPVLKMGLCEGVEVRQDKGLAMIGWNPTPVSLPAPPPGVAP